MRFEGETVDCNDCGRTIAEQDDEAHPDSDEHLCQACGGKRFREFTEEPCALCKKPRGKENLYCDEDAEEWVHGDCVKALQSEQDKEKWGEPDY